LLLADFDQWENVTYIEPFVGGGAMLLYLNAQKNIIIINILLFKKKALSLQRI